ncbi:hypothetical protein COU01_02765 [Candidatus Falkowbacteria bacterium CG10_big_fil_rev_8_21_14_0_10_44_15]|uniref:UDP-N-acetylglucosamine 2-epimerase domain-containing protein n=1 Tax=Candidatus Falkowbacteria bacterium CG10_big_fil_rev_8_21_14_0_10_44_15 TaxID=1974569 RepID=A0A2H0UZK8_9BACT|nr:MAG: hypothetical protein COU01_02765 [Candidatus Falkowbacteria bacterium CG10_big_fil_rev_8_21_14_0_10_44_15]
MSFYKEKINFIKKHKNEINPLVSDEQREILQQIFNEETKRTINKDEGVVQKQQETVEKIFEQYETKVFFLQKSPEDYDEGAQRILLTASDPYDFSIISALAKELETDRRCRYIGLATDNVAGQEFEQILQENSLDISKSNWREIKGGDIRDVGSQATYNKDYPVIADMLKMNVPDEKTKEHTKEESMDVVIGVNASKNSPIGGLLHSAKSSFGADKLLLIVGWNGVGGGNRDAIEKGEGMEKIDTILCPDELAQAVVKRQLPDFPLEDIVVTGTPQIDAIREANKSADKYAQQSREALGISEDAVAIAYLGGRSSDHEDMEDINLQVNEITCERTVAAVIELAKKNSDISYALLLRPHPRDPNKDEFLRQIEQEVPDNIKIMPATGDQINMTNLGYAADIVISMGSTENFYAVLRNRQSIFLGFEEDNLGGNILRHDYDLESLKAIAESPSMKIAHSPNELQSILSQQTKNIHKMQKQEKTPVFPAEQSSTDKMLEVIFADR